ncbi:arginyltransferase [Gallaecimonas sp. GXIMD4217]|uniref:arginyltransferase n=1 Tax=Gallaecimonas sp. GXIMD4217 TaxID=3131927 RepID=UPI00311B3447
MSANLLKGLYCGLTKPFPCSYLPKQDEQLLVITESPMDLPHYEALLGLGFRRNGDDVYRPHCPGCTACESLRLDVSAFEPDRGQRRILSKNRDVELRLSDELDDRHFALYCAYIEARHREGGMYPPSRAQLERFAKASWMPLTLLDLYIKDELAACAITDITANSLSALYTFFSPELPRRSLGKLAILKQWQLARELGKQWLYLGYHIEECSKMNYKTSYCPHERFIAGRWFRFDQCFTAPPG